MEMRVEQRWGAEQQMHAAHSLRVHGGLVLCVDGRGDCGVDELAFAAPGVCVKSTSDYTKLVGYASNIPFLGISATLMSLVMYDMACGVPLPLYFVPLFTNKSCTTASSESTICFSPNKSNCVIAPYCFAHVANKGTRFPLLGTRSSRFPMTG